MQCYTSVERAICESLCHQLTQGTDSTYIEFPLSFDPSYYYYYYYIEAVVPVLLAGSDRQLLTNLVLLLTPATIIIMTTDVSYSIS